MYKNIIEINNLRVSFKRRGKTPVEIIRGIDLNVPEGKVIGVVGETSSGKTVLAKSLIDLNMNSIVQFDSYSIDGNDVLSEKKIKLKKYRGKYISYIPKNSATSMNPTRKIGKQLLDIVNKFKKDNNSIDEQAQTQTISSKSTKVQKYEYLRELLTSLQILNPESIFNLFPHEVSVDIKQRIAIAISLIAGSKLIILDEITSQLDTTTQSSILQLIKKVSEEYKVSFLLFTSNIWIVAKTCDYIYVMYAGKIVEKATTKELLSNPKHPYTWALISSIPEPRSENPKLYSIPGNPPDMDNLLTGDPFAPRNQFAVEIDFIQEPPLFEVTSSHYAATWTLHPSYPSFELPQQVLEIISKFKKTINTTDNIDNDIKIVESSYVEEMFVEEPEIKFDVSDMREPIETNVINEEGADVDDSTVLPNTPEENSEHSIDESTSEQVPVEDTISLLTRQANMHAKINEKIKKLKKEKKTSE